MESKKGKIGLREFFGITILIIGLKLQDDTPAILFKRLDNAAWIAPINYRHPSYRSTLFSL